MIEGHLEINGQPVELSSRYSLGLTDRPGLPPEPSLYRDGKRIVQPWKLTLTIDNPPSGQENGNTA